MQAHDIMTKDVITISRDAPVAQIAALLTKHRISGVPVVTKDNEVIGIVSESDLLHRAETGTERKRKWWLLAFSHPDTLARDYVKAHGLKAGDVMTPIVYSVSEDTDIGQIADVLDGHRIKRVPVLRDGKLAGLITRADLVRALAQTEVKKGVGGLDDATLQRTVLDKMWAQSWLKSGFMSAVVNEGVVELWGFAASEDQRRALRVLLEEIDGVRGVKDNLKIGLPPSGY